MLSSVAQQVMSYAYNLFAYPDNYFENHTATELHISEEARKILIQEQKEYIERKDSVERGKTWETHGD